MPPIPRRARNPIDLRSPSPDTDISEMVSTVTSGNASRTGTASPARRAPVRRRIPDSTVIEIDDSDDDVEVVGTSGPPSPRRAGPSRATLPAQANRALPNPRISQAEFNNTMADIDEALARRRQALQHLERLERPAPRAPVPLQPTGPQRLGGPHAPRQNEAPAGSPPRIGLGGAVFRRGNVQVRFAPGHQTQRVRIQRNGEEVNDPPGPDRWRRNRRPRDINNPNFVPDFDGDDSDFDSDFDPDLEDDLDRAAHDRIHNEAGEPLDRLRPRWGVGVGTGDQAMFWRGQGAAFVNLINGLGNGAYLERAFNVIPGLGGGGGAGPARYRQEDIAAILAKVTVPTVAPADPGFTHTWDADDLVKEDKERTVIQLDEEGSVVPASKRKPYLACAACPEPLRVSAGERTPDDRVWALRCGHMLDQRCFERLAWGSEDELEEQSTKPAKRRKTRKPQVREYAWVCPVVGCGREHVSRYEDGKWSPKEGAGGIQVYI